MPTTFAPADQLQPYTVPAGVTRIKVDLRGGAGRTYSGSGLGGKGAVVSGFLTVTPGQILYVFVGRYNPPGNRTPQAADVRVGGQALTDRVMVAGAGGSASNDISGGTNGGDAGGLVGSSGPGNNGGTGGTQSAGGVGGDGNANGRFGYGGFRTDVSVGFGGDGYYGGGAGSGGDGGGGGSSYLAPSVIDGTNTPGASSNLEPQAVITTVSDPNAPTLTSLTNAATINRDTPNRASHAFSDADSGESQAAFDLRYRLTGAASWTVVHRDTPNEFYDFAAGSLTLGDYERQVRTTDNTGRTGPYSSSGFFTVVEAPPGPVITYPTNGSTVNQAERVEWTSPDQDAYQVRRVADNAGSPQTSNVYFDTDEVTNTITRSVPLTFAVNDRAEHVQVRVKNDGVWSPWSTVRVMVSYTAPSPPTVKVVPDPATGSLLVEIANPAPTGGRPAVSFNEVWVDDGTGFERRAAVVARNGTWRYWTPRSGRDYASAIRVIAYASNGIGTST